METARNGIFAPLNLLLSLMQPGGREANWRRRCAAASRGS